MSKTLRGCLLAAIFTAGAAGAYAEALLETPAPSRTDGAGEINGANQLQ